MIFVFQFCSYATHHYLLPLGRHSVDHFLIVLVRVYPRIHLNMASTLHPATTNQICGKFEVLQHKMYLHFCIGLGTISIHQK